MPLLSEIIYNIKNLRNGGEHSDDYKLGNRQLEFIINHFRAKLAAQKYNDNKSVSGFTQTLHNLKIKATRDYLPENRDAKIFKSEKQIPSMVQSHRGDVVSYLGHRDSAIDYQKTSLSLFNLDMLNPYIRRVYFTNEGYLYIVTRDRHPIREVLFRATFSNPREAVHFDQEDGSKTLGYDWNYPIPMNVLDQLNALIINNEYRWMHMLPPDLINDQQDAQIQQ